MKPKQNYTVLPKQISILIADFDIFSWKNKTKYHSIFHIRESEEQTLFSDDLEIHVLELPKLRKQPLKQAALECWLLYLDNSEGEIMEEIIRQEPLIEEAITIEQRMMKSEEERRQYEMRERAFRDRINAIATEKKRLREATKKGIKQEKINIAKNLLALNIDINQIQTATGLSIDEIKALTKNKK